MPETPAPPQNESTTDRRAVPIFGLGQQQRSPFISTVKRVNAVVELTENGRQQAAVVGLPGLVTLMTLGDLPCRAIFSISDTLTFYVITGDQIIRASVNQTPVVLGTLTTNTGPAWIDSNGTQLFINDGVTAMIYTLATQTITQISDADYPVGAAGGTFLQGRFWVYVPVGVSAQSGRVYGSAQYDGLAWDALDFFTPEAVPDGIVGVTRWFNDLVIFGHQSIEWWSGSPSTLLGALGFAPITGASTEVGLVAPQGFAGTNQTLFFLGHSNGSTGVYKLTGYSAVKVSTPSIDDELAMRPTAASAICTAYMVGGHPIFQVTLPHDQAANALTIIYDAGTELWSWRETLTKPYYTGLLATSHSDAVYITDAFTGLISQMVETVYTENGNPMVFEVSSMHLLKEGDRLAVNEIQVDCEVGVSPSTGQGSDPQAMIQVSKDAGHTWVAERWAGMGKIGKYRWRAIRRRIGASRDLAIRFRITDPIPRRITGAYVRLSGGVS